MNKKFSTLVASLLLATTVGTGYAQVQKGTISERPDMAYINAIEEGKFYQLTNGTKVHALNIQTSSDLSTFQAFYFQ